MVIRTLMETPPTAYSAEPDSAEADAEQESTRRNDRDRAARQKTDGTTGGSSAQNVRADHARVRAHFRTSKSGTESGGEIIKDEKDHTIAFTMGDKNAAESNTITNKAGEFPQPPEADIGAISAVRSEARHKLNTEEGKDLHETVKDVVHNITIAIKPTGNVLKQKKNTPEALEPESETPDSAVTRAKRFLIGYFTEKLDALVPLDRVQTIYAGADASPKMLTQYEMSTLDSETASLTNEQFIWTNLLSRVDDMESYRHFLGNERYAVLQLLSQKVSEKEQETIIGIAVHAVKHYITHDYGRLQRSDKQTERILQDSDIPWSNPFTDKVLSDLIWREKLNKKEDIPFYTHVAAQIDAITSRLNELTHKERGDSDEIIPLEDSLYPEISKPDAILNNKATGKPEGVVEIKGYTQEEVHAWIEALNEGVESPGIAGKGSLRFDYLSKSGESMTLGFSPLQQHRFISLLNEEPLDMRVRPSNETTIPPGGRPTVLRFLNDVPDELLIELGDAIQKRGFTNIIIQKIPFTEEMIADVARRFLMRNATELAKNIETDPVLARKPAVKKQVQDVLMQLGV